MLLEYTLWKDWKDIINELEFKSKVQFFNLKNHTSFLFGISKEAAHSASFFGSGSKGIAAVKAIAHGLTRGAIAKAQGQTFKGGFWSGFASSGFSVGNKGFGKGATGFMTRTAIMSIVGGTASKLGGGKFANGAVSGAFVHMFNAEAGTFSRIWKGLTSSMSTLNDRKGEILSDAKIALSSHVKDIPKALEGGLNGYRDVRDNAPMIPRYMLKGAMTAVELGLTGWIKDPALYIYVNVNSAVMLDTIPYTNPVSAVASEIHNYSGHDSSWFK